MSQLNQQIVIDYEYRPEYNFSNFIQTGATKVAYQAALSVAKKRGGKYNPLYIYGENGVGKTHLLIAIGNEIRSSTNNAVIIYVNSKKILTDRERAISEFDAVSLVKDYSDVDFLLIDDIDKALTNSSMDEKIFHLFNYLMQRGKHIIFASSSPPFQLKFIDLNLKTRLESGLTVKIEKMNDEDKRKVIKKLAKDFDLFIPNNVVHYILNFAPRDFISLFKTVKQINRLSLEAKKKITLPFIKKALKHDF